MSASQSAVGAIDKDQTESAKQEQAEEKETVPVQSKLNAIDYTDTDESATKPKESGAQAKPTDLETKPRDPQTVGKIYGPMTAQRVKDMEKMMKLNKISLDKITDQLIKPAFKSGKKWVLERKRHEKKTTENEGQLVPSQKRPGANKHPQPKSETKKQKKIALANLKRRYRPSIDSCKCNAYNNSHRCVARKPIVCFCFCAYQRGTDGFVYHALCQCCN